MKKAGTLATAKRRNIPARLNTQVSTKNTEIEPQLVILDNNEEMQKLPL